MKSGKFAAKLMRIVEDPETTKKLTRYFNITMALGFLLVFISITAVPALADGGPVDKNGLGAIMAMFKTLGDTFISLAYYLMVILFAVGTVKSGLAAQAAQQFGATGRVSMEWMNLASGVVIFIIGLISMPIVKWILSKVETIVSPAQMKIEVPPGFVVQ